MQKAIKAIAKASLYFPSIFWRIDEHITYGKEPAENKRSFNQEVLIKDAKTKVLKELNAYASETILDEVFNKMHKKKKRSTEL